MAYLEHSDKIVLTDDTVSRALQHMFGDSATSPELMPRLSKIDRTNSAYPMKIGEKNVEERIEYKLLKDAQRDDDGHLTLGSVIRHYHKVANKEFQGRTYAELSGLRLIAILGFCAGVDAGAKTEIRHFIEGAEYNINAGERECGGRHSSLVNSGLPQIEEVNCWVRNRPYEPRQKPQPIAAYTDQAATPPRSTLGI